MSNSSTTLLMLRKRSLPPISNREDSCGPFSVLVLTRALPPLCGAALAPVLASQDCTLTKKSAKTGFAEATGIIHHIQWEHHSAGQHPGSPGPPGDSCGYGPPLQSHARSLWDGHAAIL